MSMAATLAAVAARTLRFISSDELYDVFKRMVGTTASKGSEGGGHRVTFLVNLPFTESDPPLPRPGPPSLVAFPRLCVPCAPGLLPPSPSSIYPMIKCGRQGQFSLTESSPLEKPL